MDAQWQRVAMEIHEVFGVFNRYRKQGWTADGRYRVDPTSSADIELYCSTSRIGAVDESTDDQAVTIPIPPETQRLILADFHPAGLEDVPKDG
jgi:hypothetical protein